MRHGHHSSYISKVFDPDTLLTTADAILRPHLERFELFVGRGLSGAMVVPLLGYHFYKRFAVVRKDNDNSHGTHRVEGVMYDGDRWLFVDDLISTGSTRTAVRDAMVQRTMGVQNLKYVGDYLYQECNDTFGAGVRWEPGVLADGPEDPIPL